MWGVGKTKDPHLAAAQLYCCLYRPPRLTRGSSFLFISEYFLYPGYKQQTNVSRKSSAFPPDSRQALLQLPSLSQPTMPT